MGLLTSLPRHEWAEARAQLGAVSETNRAALHAIDSAIFCVSLTEGTPSTLHIGYAHYGYNRRYTYCIILAMAGTPSSLGDVQRLALHGGGADRWLDQSF